MALKIFPPAEDIANGARLLYSFVEKMNAPADNSCWQIPLDNFDFLSFFASIKGMIRTYFKSRDRDFSVCGLGMADRVAALNLLDNTTLSLLKSKAASLFDGQCYVGGMRFDGQSFIAKEWQIFGREFFVLPLLMVERKLGIHQMILNFRVDGCLPFTVWRDQALSILQALSRVESRDYPRLLYSTIEELPPKNDYYHTIEHALRLFCDNDERQKVVIGRRNSLSFAIDHDPMAFFSALAKKTEKCFLFLLDHGQGTCFFGASPELLYRRDHGQFFTESLAGTRPRNARPEEDERLEHELFHSAKDQSEHALVCEHVEALLKDFGARDLITSQLSVMSLSYARHLVKSYNGEIDPNLGDDKILSALHPTPAVSGTKRQWALEFIRNNEGFDRGFYAGPIGYIHNAGAEFAVGIRSALYHEKKLYIYAASGIVKASLPEQEWEELNNKQKMIMSIFTG
ncbi:MAG TPA: isochorismate synthase [Myxococcota bacterium]|nr:isochorismate synthase [Myxococcota bacterium]